MSFCQAAAKLYTRPKNLFAADIVWTSGGQQMHKELSAIRSGIRVLSQSFDATPSNRWKEIAFDGDISFAIWAMPYPDRYLCSTWPISESLKEDMRERIENFVRIASVRVPKVAVVLVCKQHLAWGLSNPIAGCGASQNTTWPATMRVFDLSQLIENGYTPEFGDVKDLKRTPTYHLSSEAVLVMWTKKAEIGMSDAKLMRRL